MIGCEVPYLGGKRWVDILLMTKQRLVAYEIKSESDSLRRFEKQCPDYLATFDMTFLVVSDRQIKSFNLERYPKSLGIITYKPDDFKFSIKRKPIFSEKQSKLNLSYFIWKDELSGFQRDSISTAHNLRINFSKKNSIQLIRKLALNSLRKRYRQRYGRFLKERGQVTTISDLKFLTDENPPLRKIL
jgi:hypothetical protein